MADENAKVEDQAAGDNEEAQVDERQQAVQEAAQPDLQQSAAALETQESRAAITSTEPAASDEAAEEEVPPSDQAAPQPESSAESDETDATEGYENPDDEPAGEVPADEESSDSPDGDAEGDGDDSQVIVISDGSDDDAAVEDGESDDGTIVFTPDDGEGDTIIEGSGDSEDQVVFRPGDDSDADVVVIDGDSDGDEDPAVEQQPDESAPEDGDSDSGSTEGTDGSGAEVLDPIVDETVIIEPHEPPFLSEDDEQGESSEPVVVDVSEQAREGVEASRSTQIGIGDRVVSNPHLQDLEPRVELTIEDDDDDDQVEVDKDDLVEKPVVEEQPAPGSFPGVPGAGPAAAGRESLDVIDFAGGDSDPTPPSKAADSLDAGDLQIARPGLPVEPVLTRPDLLAVEGDDESEQGESGDEDGPVRDIPEGYQSVDTMLAADEAKEQAGWSDEDEDDDIPQGYQSVDTMLASEEAKERAAEQEESGQQFSDSFLAEHRMVVEQPAPPIHDAAVENLRLPDQDTDDDDDESEGSDAQAGEQASDSPAGETAKSAGSVVEGSGITSQLGPNIDISRFADADELVSADLVDSGVAESAEAAELVGGDQVRPHQGSLVSDAFYSDEDIIVTLGDVTIEDEDGSTTTIITAEDSLPDGVTSESTTFHWDTGQQFSETVFEDGSVHTTVTDGEQTIDQLDDESAEFTIIVEKEGDEIVSSELIDWTDDEAGGTAEDDSSDGSGAGAGASTAASGDEGGESAGTSSSDDTDDDSDDDSDDDDDDSDDDDQDDETETETSEQDDSSEDESDDDSSAGDEGTPNPMDDGGDGPPLFFVTEGRMGQDQMDTVEKGIDFATGGGHTDPVEDEAGATAEFITSRLGREQLDQTERAVEQAQSGGHTDPVDGDDDTPSIPVREDLDRIEFIVSGGGAVDPVDDQGSGGVPAGGGIVGGGGAGPVADEDDDPEDPDSGDEGATVADFQVASPVSGIASGFFGQLQEQDIEVDVDEVDLEDDI